MITDESSTYYLGNVKCDHLKSNSYKQIRTNLEQRINELQSLQNDLQQRPPAQQQEHSMKLREIAAEAEEMKKQLHYEKIQLEDICQE